MANSVNKTLFLLHGWIGLTLGLLLFIVCFSGTIATVSSEIDWLLNPAIRARSAGPGTERSWERWRQGVSKAHPAARLVSLSAPPSEGWAADAVVVYGGSDVRHVYLHPDTGEVQGTFSQFNVARFFRSFHKQFYIYPGELPHGAWFVGPLALVLLASVGTGIGFYKIRWRDLFMRRRSGGARAWLSSFHRASGVWMLVFSLIFGVTGVWYFVERVALDLGVNIPGVEALSADAEKTISAGGEPVSLDAAVAAAHEAFPEMRVQTIFFSYRPGTALTLYGSADAWLVRLSANHVAVDPYTGEVLGKQDARDLAVPARLIQSVDPLHFGYFGGLPTKLLWLAAGLLISASVLAGTFLWVLRMRQGGTAQHALPPVVARSSLAVTLAVLALTTYGSIVNIGNAISHEGGSDLAPAYVWFVIAGFVGITALVSVGWLAVLVKAPSGRGAA